MKKSLRTTLLIALGIMALFTAGVFVRDLVQGAFNESSAVTYSVYVKTNTIEDSTLFIGTYLIHKDALNDELYEKAQDSASQSGQSTIYYKSELDHGKWFDITNAESLNDIAGSGDPVGEDVLGPLFIEYVIGSNGTMTNALTGAVVNPFDVPDPYDLKSLPELSAVWQQYASASEPITVSLEDYLKNHNSEARGTVESDTYLYNVLTQFFGMDLRNARTYELDRQVNSLYEAYKRLKAAGKDAEADVVHELIAKVDSARRTEVFYQLCEMDKNLLQQLFTYCSGSDYDPNVILTSDEEEEEEDEEEEEEEPETDVRSFATDANLMEAIGTAMQECDASYSKHAANRLEDAESVLGHREYEYSMEVINSSASDASVENLIVIRNISSGLIVDRTKELRELNSYLIDAAQKAYARKLAMGESAEYKASVKNNESAAAAKKALDNQQAEVETARSDLQFLIKAKVDRLGAADALKTVLDLASGTDSMREGIRDDAFSPYASTSVDALKNWLKDLAADIKASDDSLKSKLDELKEKKEELQEKRLEALDDNDLALAADLELQIEAVDLDIRKEEALLAAKLKGAGSSGGDDLDTLNQLGNSLAALGEELKNDLLTLLAEGNLDLDGPFGKGLEALAQLGDTDSLGALKDILEKMAAGTGDGSGDGSGSGSGSGMDPSIKDALKKVADCIDESEENSLLAEKSGLGTDILSMNADQLMAYLESLMGEAFDDMSDEEKVVFVGVVSGIADKGNTDAKRLAGILAGDLLAQRNGYVYKQYKKSQEVEYIEASTVAYVAGCRYSYDDAITTAYLDATTVVYTFAAGNLQVTLSSAANPEEIIEIGREPQMQSRQMYLAETDTEEIFQCHALYVNSSDYALCLNKELEESISEILDIMMAAQ